MKPISGETVNLRGFERFVTAKDGVSMKIVHSMLVQGDSAEVMQTMVQQLPLALVKTFNKHPRMRIILTRNKFATAQVLPAFSLEDVSKFDLLRLETCQFEDGNACSKRWERFVEQECEVAIDRYTHPPFFLTVWIDSDKPQAQLMLFSDHFACDGFSGLVVLNDILTFVAELSRLEASAPNHNPEDDDALPLRPSLYVSWRAASPIRTSLSEVVVKLIGPILFRGLARSFHGLLPARDDQRDMTSIPPEYNGTRVHFARGDRANLPGMLEACRRERVTIGGALIAAIVAAHAHVTGFVENGKLDEKFYLTLDLDYNMRKRLPIVKSNESSDIVGPYVAITTLEDLKSKGVNIHKTKFWDFARATKQEIDDTLKHAFDMQLGMLFLDQYMHANVNSQRVLKGLKIPNSLQADVNLSNLGRYPFAEHHEMKTVSGSGRITIESLHLYNSMPTLGPACCVFATCVGGALNYSFAYKLEDEVALKVFTSVVAVSEKLAVITEDVTIADVVRSLLG